MTRRTHPITTLAAMLALALMLAPLLATVVFSFNSARTGLTWEGFTLHWYTVLLSNAEIGKAVLNSLFVATVSTAISTVLGVLLAVALERYPRSPRAGKLVEAIVDLPVVTPDILFAAALVIAFSVLREWSSAFMPGLLTMVLGHVVFEVSFVALVVRSRLAVIGESLSEAGHDLYATPWSNFMRVTLPLILPAIAIGAAMAFTLSLDDVVISFFTSGPDSTTLPIYIYSTLRRGLKPDIHALSTLMIVVAAVMACLSLYAADRLRR